jgi:hypothetical protein
MSELPALTPEILREMTADERQFVEMALEMQKQKVWTPLPGPQLMAFESTADVIGFGGSAGGGKTDLLIGKALQKHTNATFIRKESTQLSGIQKRLAEILGNWDGFSGAPPPTWENAGPRKVNIEFGSLANPGDEQKQQGRPKDLLGLDEATNLPEAACRFLMGWVRTTIPGQPCQTIMTFNPPTTAEGRWVISFFGPWLEKTHPDPAEPGELRYFATINGKDLHLGRDARSFILDSEGNPDYDYDPKDYQGARRALVVKPQSRTFIPSRITDNPYLLETGYMATLQALPEPLRSQMLYGDFEAGTEDDPWQVCPTAWVDAAMRRWKEPDVKGDMLSMGVDIARGGKDTTVIARRHRAPLPGTSEHWYDKPLQHPGKDTPDGPSVAGLVVAAARDDAPQHLDIIGVGSSPYDFLANMRQQVVGVNVAEKSHASDKSGRLTFINKRAELYWKFRELLDPANNHGVALPPNNQLKADLCAPRWFLQGTKIAIESRDDIVRRIGRSPDMASAYVLAAMDTPKLRKFYGSDGRSLYLPEDVNMGLDKTYKGHDPYSQI